MEVMVVLAEPSAKSLNLPVTDPNDGRWLHSCYNLLSDHLAWPLHVSMQLMLEVHSSVPITGTAPAMH